MSCEHGFPVRSMANDWVSPGVVFIATDKQDPRSGTPSDLMSKYVHQQTIGSSRLKHIEMKIVPASSKMLFLVMALRPQ